MRPKKPERYCTNCGWGVVVARGECRTCLMWRRNHDGEQRPISAILAHADRMLHKRFIEEAAR